ncbi:mannosyltransferase putative-domain-containing protein, partial [Coniella lustricola]
LAAVVILTVAGVYLPHHDTATQQPVNPAQDRFYTTKPAAEHGPGYASPPAPNDLSLRFATDLVRYFEDYPLYTPPPHGGDKEVQYFRYFGEQGRRTALLADVLDTALSLSSNSTASDDDEANQQHQSLLRQAVDNGAALLYPFLHHAPKSSPLRHSTDQPDDTRNTASGLSHLRDSFVPGSAGIVIPVGNRNLRHAAHLITSLRRVLGSTLPIQIACSGDGDLSPDNRAFLERIHAAAHPPSLEFLNVLTVFSDRTLHLRKQGSWAIKPFALLASRFETVILVNADTVFLQKPEALLAHGALQRAGTLLFRDRLLLQQAQHAAWIKSQIPRPSEALRSSRAWTGSKAAPIVPHASEQGDAGVVVLDKSRPRVLMALLHTCWQNSYPVRQQLAQQGLVVVASAHTAVGGGDKESWWLGLELAGAAYEMEEPYGAMVGWPREALLPSDAGTKVCSSSSYQGLAHLDESGKLLWYGGGLAKNMRLAKSGYKVPTAWMAGGQWRLGYELDDPHCMVGADQHALSAQEKEILHVSIKAAKSLDGLL